MVREATPDLLGPLENRVSQVLVARREPREIRVLRDPPVKTALPVFEASPEKEASPAPRALQV